MSAGGPESRPVEAVGGTGVGPALRAARERKGLSVASVTEALHVDSRVIEAMEAGNFSVFDAPVYARGFIRKYASFLGVPADDLIANYDSLSGGPAIPTLIPPTTATPPPADLSKVTTPILIVLALVAVGGALWWWFSRPHGPSAPAPAPTAATTTTVVAGVPPPAQVIDQSVPLADSVSQPEPPITAPERAGAPERAPSRAAANAAAAASVLVVHGLRECWVEVYAPTGARLFSDLVKAGDSHTLPGPGPWRVFLGNADGVRLSVDEHTIEVPAAYRAGATARFLVAANGTVK